MKNEELMVKAAEFMSKNVDEISYFFVHDKLSREQLDKEASYVDLPAGSSVEEINAKIRQVLVDPEEWEVDTHVDQDWEYNGPEDLDDFVWLVGEVFVKPETPRILRSVIVYPHEIFSDNIFVEFLLDGDTIVAWNMNED